MLTHFSILASKIPWTKKPGKLQSIGVAKSQTRLSDFTFTLVIISLTLLKKVSLAFLLIFLHMVYLQIKTVKSAYIVKFLEHGYFSLKNSCQKTI